MMIIDAHAHIADSDFGSVAIYFDQLREAGIERGVVVPGGMIDVRRITDYIIGRARPSKNPPANDYVETQVRAHPGRLAGLYCANPHDPAAAEQLEAALERGARGLKLSPLSHEFTFAGRSVADLAARCSARRLPVYTHVLYNPGVSTERFVSLARQFKGTPFILGHMGFGPADQDALKAAATLDNFFLETSTGNYLTIQAAVAAAGPGKVIFGSEFPLSHPAVELEKILRLRISDDAKEKILAHNAYELFRLGDVWGSAGP